MRIFLAALSIVNFHSISAARTKRVGLRPPPSSGEFGSTNSQKEWETFMAATKYCGTL